MVAAGAVAAEGGRLQWFAGGGTSGTEGEEGEWAAGRGGGRCAVRE